MSPASLLGARVTGALLLVAAVACGESQSDGPLAVERIESARPSGGGGGGGGGTTGPTVKSTNPTGSSPGVTLDVRVLGSGYDAGSRADFALKGVVGPNVVTNRTTYVSSKELVANITIASTADVALYDVIVTAGTGRKGIGTEMFEVAYLATDLGTLGGSEAEAFAINDRNQVVGWSKDQSGVIWPFISENGQMRKIDPSLRGTASDINGLGWIVGRSDDGRPWLWKPGGGIQWLELPAGATSGQVEAINDAGQIVGSAGNGLFLWQEARIVQALDFVPYAVNNGGIVVGSGWSGGRQGSVRWSVATGTVFLGGTPDGAEALDVNDAGDIVGWYATEIGADGLQYNGAYLWRDGTRTRLARMSDQLESSVANGISPQGEMIVGRWESKPALWSDGKIQLLGSIRTTRISATGEARDVNSNGWIAGVSGGRAVIWRAAAAK
jgi:uncharacterized membrane protein